MPKPGYSRVREILDDLPPHLSAQLMMILENPATFPAEDIEGTLTRSGYPISDSAIRTWRRKNLPREELHG